MITSRPKKSLTCEYCNKIFSRHNVMITHQLTVKKCIELQKNQGKVPEIKEYVCKNDYCRKSFQSSSAVVYHMERCKMTNEQISMQLQMQQLKEEVQQLKNATIHNTTNTTNSHNTNSHNTVNNITINQWMTEERILQIFNKHFSTRQLEAKELAQFTMTHLVNGEDKPIYLCTDPSRQRMVFFDGSGNEQVDENCKVLIDKMMQAKRYVKDLIQDEIIDNTVDEIERLKPLYSGFVDLHKNRDYKLELSKGLPRTRESANRNITFRTNPDNEDDIEWDINERLQREREQEFPREEIETSEDPFGFFS